MFSWSKLPEFWIPDELKEVLVNRVEPNYAYKSKKSRKFVKILQALKNVDRLELSKKHYLQLLKLGLYLEEFQCVGDLRKFNLNWQKVERLSKYSNEFKVSIKNLDKDHPLYKCSIVELIDVKDGNRKKYILRAKEVFDDYVVLISYPEFCDSYEPENMYNVRFRLNNYSFKCSHHALTLTNSYEMTSYLFPVRNKNIVVATSTNEQKWYNKLIANNPEQKQAVVNIIHRSSFPAPYILYGPPGTGKTATVVEAICQIYHETTENVLVCAPSNTAADVITKRLLDYVPVHDIDRLYGRSRNCSLIDEDIKSCSNYLDGRIVKINENLVSSKRIIISTMCTCARLAFMNLSTTFSYVFIDEAGQSTEPESLIPINLIEPYGSSNCQIVISGDPQQLGPCIRSKYAAPILGQSILERLMKTEPYQKLNNNDYDPCYITKLLRNYRSHPAIIQISNELYYDKQLIACNDEMTNKSFLPQFPIIFHGVRGIEEKEQSSASSYNDAEITEVMNYVRVLADAQIGSGKVISQADIGIVTPFALQSRRIQEILKQHNLDQVTVGTVEIFQGQEKEVIIVSTVRSRTFVHEHRKHIGFLSNPRRFNVALTRAKSLLVVVGNPDVLKTDKNWEHFLRFCQSNRACKGEEFELEKNYGNRVEHSEMLTCKESSGLFKDIFDIMDINDGMMKIKNNQIIMFNGKTYEVQECPQKDSSENNCS